MQLTTNEDYVNWAFTAQEWSLILLAILPQIIWLF